MTTLYATLSDARDENKAGTTNTQDDVYLVKALRAVSKRVDRMMGNQDRPYFAPYIEARNIPITGANVDSYNGLLMFPGNLLELTAVSNNGSALTVGTDVSAYSDTGQAPYGALQLGLNYCRSWYDICSSSARPLTTITGPWGYTGDYAYAWQKVDTLRAAIDGVTPTIPFNTVNAQGYSGNTPTVSAGHLLKIDTELILVNATDNTAKTATGQRGGNGSTATSHLIGADIFVWQVEEDLKEIVAKQAGMMNSRRGAYTSMEVMPMGGEVRYPSDLLPALRGVLNGYVYT